MTEVSQLLLWCMVQVAIISLVTVFLAWIVTRKNPAAGVWCLRTGIAFALVMTLLSPLPLPSWFATANTKSDLQRQSNTSVDSANNSLNTTDSDTLNRPSIDPNQSAVGLLTHLKTAFRETVSQPAKTATSTVPANKQELSRSPLGAFVRWIIGAFVIGAIWFLIGIFSVRRVLLKCEDIDDPRATEMLDIVVAEMSCTRRIRLAEVELGSAATVGFFKPVLLLPGTWYDWTDEELKAVLAHEVAHVQANDFAATVFSQFVVAIHFLNPCVHFLTRQLRVTQELAADATASTLAGGRTNYATVLASMALRTDKQPNQWATQAFLPAPRTLLRRIEMLRDADTLKTKVGRTGRLLLTSCLVLTMCAVAGLRANPWQPEDLVANTTPANVMQATSPTTVTESSLSLDWVPNGSLFVVSIKPAEFLKQDSFKPIADALREQAKQIGIDLSSIDSLTLSATTPDRAPILILRGTNALAWAEAELGSKQEQKTSGSQTVYGLNSGAWFSPDGSTVVTSFGATIESGRQSVLQVAAAGKNSTTNRYWHEQWKTLKDQPTAILFDIGAAREIPGRNVRPNPAVVMPKASLLQNLLGPAIYQATSPIWTKGELLALSIAPTDRLRIEGRVTTVSDEDAANVQTTLKAAVVLLQNVIARQERSLARSTQPQGAMLASLVNNASLALDKATLIQNGPNVEIKASIDNAAVLQLSSVAVPAIRSARGAARRTQGQNNLKQIALALHNYHAVHKKFPPAYSMGKDGGGKQRVSWRVLILPYLDQTELYDSYNFDERWDSDHNKKVTSQMPRVFAYPGTPTTNVHSAYFGVVSTNLEAGRCGFDRYKGARIRDFTDGTSNSLLVVEAKKEIHWAQPQDLEWDIKGDLPKFGGFDNDTFSAARADGSVLAISSNSTPATLKLFVTINDGQVVNQSDLAPN